MIKIGNGRYQEVFRHGNNVYKFTKPLSSLKLSRMEEYYKSLSCAGVSVPKYFGYSQSATEWSYTGEPLAKIILEETPEKVMDFMNQVLQMGFKTYKHNVAFYPILEQFTVSGDTVFFVDFFPSRTREDFLEYSLEKREILSLMFCGLTQKIATPIRQLLSLRPKLREETSVTLLKFLKKESLDKLTDQFFDILDFELSDFEEEKPLVGIKNGRVQYYDCLSKLVDLDWILTLPSRNVWTQELFNKDLDNVISLGLVERPQE